MVMGKRSLERSPTDPLEDFDVIYNLGQVYPPKQHPTARARLQAFFERGGGYIGTSASSAKPRSSRNAVPNLIEGWLAQTSDSADGGIAKWSNIGAVSATHWRLPRHGQPLLAVQHHVVLLDPDGSLDRWTVPPVAERHVPGGVVAGPQCSRGQTLR